MLWDPTSVGEENETFLIRVWKPLLSRLCLKIVRLTTIRNGVKRTISTSGGFRLLQIRTDSKTLLRIVVRNTIFIGL